METRPSYEIDSYKRINMIFIIMIMFIFFYCYLSSFLNFGIGSLCKGMPLSYCKSRGLTRAFSQILNLNFKEALAYNPYSLKIFSFFLIQLMVRLLINKMLRFSNFKLVLAFDIVFSITFFIYSFYNLVII